MQTAFELAGFFAAHGIWCVSDGSPLTPMLAYTAANGERQMLRLAHEDLEQAVSAGKQQLADNEVNANDAALIFDAVIHVDGESLDSLIVEIRSYISPHSEAVLAIPFSPPGEGPFRIHKVKLVEWKGCEDFDMEAAFEAFFQGVEGHEQGASIWEQSLDESK